MDSERCIRLSRCCRDSHIPLCSVDTARCGSGNMDAVSLSPGIVGEMFVGIECFEWYFSEILLLEGFHLIWNRP